MHRVSYGEDRLAGFADEVKAGRIVREKVE